jgi:uncharacterized protein YkwD
MTRRPRSHLPSGTAGLALLVCALSGAAAAPTAATCALPDFVATTLARINDVRARGADCGSGGRFGPAPPVAWSDALARSAEAHSRDMVAKNRLSHETTAGRTLGDRATDAGYRWASLAENVAGGYPDIDAVVAGWVKSPGHCRNLLAAKLSEVGLACVPGSARSTYPNYWTLNMGRPR